MPEPRGCLFNELPQTSFCRLRPREILLGRQLQRRSAARGAVVFIIATLSI